MPTYEYECKSCSHTFEVFQSMREPPLKNCPECGKEIRRLIFGGTGVIFKGSGFYVTDKSKSAVSSSQKNSASSPCAQCPASKAEGETGKCPVAAEADKSERVSSEKSKPESKSA